MKLGIIGGTGVYNCGDKFSDLKEIAVSTPFGKPSDKIMTASFDGVELFFLPRHAKGHTVMPSEINHKANIYAMKAIGVTHILSLSAVGSLKEEYKPRDVVIIDQFFDRTKRNPMDHTFFGNGVVGHIPFGDPICSELASLAYGAAVKTAKKIAPETSVHKGGTYVNMEGPAFSTKAESKVYRMLGMDVIGMTNMGEAKLAREAGICYATVAFITDYDCWHSDFGSVTVEAIIEHITANKLKAYEIITNLAVEINNIPCKCSCAAASKTAIVTATELIPEKTRNDLTVIFPTLKG
jgi:5'-methylthioadenosine phosphorylase